MKNYLYIPGITFLIFILFSCEGPRVAFDQPQPAKEKSLSRINRKHAGIYRQEKHSNSENVLPYSKAETVYEVNPKYIIRHYTIDIRYLISDTSKSLHPLFLPLDSLSRADSDSLKFHLSLTTRGDTADVHITKTDTVFFYKNDKYVLKRYKDKYYCNVRIDEYAWNAMQLSFLNSLLIVRTTSKDDEELLSGIASYRKRSSFLDTLETKGIREGLGIGLAEGIMDYTQYAYLVNPSQKEFEEFVEKKGFGKREEFLKIR